MQLKYIAFVCLVFAVQCSPIAQDKPQIVTTTPVSVGSNNSTMLPNPALQTDKSLSIIAQVKDFLPRGYYILKSVEGDINNDGRADVAAAFSKSNPETAKADETGENLDAPRLLFLALRDEKGLFQETIVTDKVILCRSCGTMVDDPLLDISIKDGTVHIEQFNLGACDVTYSYAIDYRQGWQIIGQTKSHDRKSGKEEIFKQRNPLSLFNFDIGNIKACD